MGSVETKQVNFVTFMSPGMIVSEHCVQISSWDPKEAAMMAKKLSIKPFGFLFKTLIVVTDDGKDVPIKTVKKSGIFYIGGRVEMLKDIEMRNNPADKILISNMRTNNKTHCVRCNDPLCGSYFFESNDVLIDSEGNVVIPPGPELTDDELQQVDVAAKFQEKLGNSLLSRLLAEHASMKVNQARLEELVKRYEPSLYSRASDIPNRGTGGRTDCDNCKTEDRDMLREGRGWFPPMQ